MGEEQGDQSGIYMETCVQNPLMDVAINISL